MVPHKRGTTTVPVQRYVRLASDAGSFMFRFFEVPYHDSAEDTDELQCRFSQRTVELKRRATRLPYLIITPTLG